MLIFLAAVGCGCTASILTPVGDKQNATRRRDSGSYVQAAYFTNWGIYGANFQPTDINPVDLTHILYAFADVSSQTGEVILMDPYADEQKHFPGDSWSEPGNNLYGCLKQLYLLKLAHRHLKVLLSVGGYTYSQEGHFSFITDPNGRANFVSSAVQIIKDYGFDGIDIDFEYPANDDEGQGFADLLTSLRASFDELASTNGDTVTYELTAAISAGAQHYAHYPISQVDEALSYWNLMAYDYAGSWLTWADNQANLYGGARTGVSTDSAVKYLVSAGASSSKITMGIPLYGRAFEDTNGIGQPYSGIGPGTIQAGIYSYKDLPLAGAQIFEDTEDVASYSYDARKRELVSYDTPNVVRTKADYVMSNSMAGCMFWDLSSDKAGSDSLVRTAANVLGDMDRTLNHIWYPDSKWDNIRNNMGGSISPPPPTPTSTPPWQLPPPTSSIAPVPTSTTPPSSDRCMNMASWRSGVVYKGGEKAVYMDHLWTAKWWTENDVPGGSGMLQGTSTPSRFRLTSCNSCLERRW
ncbi:carbohydrate-binding module family 5 protein [Hydnomerulius pinastri MD-312]|uniref:chitinase n=1 Tax=Hydnomerulius pinastri MD-312 TaxID=994086 RepID=A0A0C9WAY1_9AGAM|nr:carbohydrate-binding module family 5 protein [Hydnomerulius pinastri MD-312]